MWQGGINMQSLELNIPNHNKHRGKCGELQKICLKCKPRKDGSPHCRVDVPRGYAADWWPLGPPVPPGEPQGGSCCRGTGAQPANITASLGMLPVGEGEEDLVGFRAEC